MDPSPCMRTALELLLQARDYAADINCECWEFAVEIAYLHNAGLTVNDVRWLLLRSYVQHAVEVTEPDEGKRAFHDHGLCLASRSCFVLTPSGLEFARAVATHTVSVPTEPERDSPTVRPSVEPTRGPFPVSLKPRWDKDRRALLYGPHLVKQFKVPAPNQETILATFDEEHWPIRIDDPLPMHCSIDPKKRLHDTINSLNRNQKRSVLRFQGDGTGEAICWSSISLEEPNGAGARRASLSG